MEYIRIKKKTANTVCALVHFLNQHFILHDLEHTYGSALICSFEYTHTHPYLTNVDVFTMFAPPSRGPSLPREGHKGTFRGSEFISLIHIFISLSPFIYLFIYMSRRSYNGVSGYQWRLCDTFA